MAENKDHIELRSEEVQEIMSHVPNWMIRWGITLIFTLIVMGVFITWFIKYPDVISGSVTITTEQQTIKLVTKSSGEIIYLAKDNEEVKKGDLIGSINATLSSEAKEHLVLITAEIERELSNNILNIEFKDQGMIFGSLHESYSSLKKTILDYQFFLENNNMLFEIQNLEEQIKNHTILRSVSYQQLSARQKLLKQTEEQYASSERLYEKNVISKAKLFEEQEKLALSENAVAETKKASVQSSIVITDLKKQLHSLEVDYEKKDTEFINSIQSQLATINNALRNWESNYEFRAQTDGRLAYMQNLSIHQHVESGVELFALIPNNQEYLGHITVPKQGYGKLKVGQKVRIKLDNYPYHEYGQLEGVVTSISVIPNEENYRVEFSLINGMHSSYGKEFKYTPEMSGTAEIITEDLRLMERIFNKFRKILD